MVGSTLAGESQVLSDGFGHLEWMLCLLCEARYHDFDLHQRDQYFARVPSTSVVDCKSVYNHVVGTSTPANVSDKRVAVDMVIVRESLQRTSTQLRWAPSEWQLAAVLTKDKAEPADMFRGVLNRGCYRLDEEDNVLELAKQERTRRQQLKLGHVSVIDTPRQEIMFSVF